MTVDQQQLQLLAQIKEGLLPGSQGFLLAIALVLPLPIAWKLNAYNWLISLPIPPMSPMVFTIVIAVTPITLIIGLYLIVKLIVTVFRVIVPLILTRFASKEEPKKLLELTFPALTDKSAYATEQLYILLHTLSRQSTLWDRLTQKKNEYCLELVSTKKEGIRYILSANPKYLDIVSSSILSYLPGIKIKEISDYLGNYIGSGVKSESTKLVELKLKSHFALPLHDQTALSENDPISYITGIMTKLASNEIISLQIVVSPVVSRVHRNIVAETNALRLLMYQGKPLTGAVQKNTFETFVSLPGISILWLIIRGLWKVLCFLPMFGFSVLIALVDPNNKSIPFLATPTVVIPENILNPYEKELATVIKGKIDQPLFEASIRLLVRMDNASDQTSRINGLLAALGQMSSSYQAFTTKGSLLGYPTTVKRLESFEKRSLSPNLPFNQNPVLSASELSDLFHFPYMSTTKTDGLIKVHSRQLPAPLSVKNNSDFDVVFGKNTFANANTDIGLTDDDRSRHVYMIGQTGSGKSTVIFHMAKDDINKGRGVAIIDPHGDLAEDLLSTVPEKRINDCIYFNPFDLHYPIGINLLEITPGLIDDELEQEKELVCESVISVFRRIFSKDENTDAHRIEYILRNTIYTAFTIKDATIFTVYNLLNDPKFQKSVTANLEDENLLNFWKYEFGRAGNYQVVKMVSGVTSRIGRFLFSPTAKRILEQPRSTINFDDILSSGKILICNLAEGKLGEDTSQLLGTTIIAKLQQSAMRRVRSKKIDRTPFYLYIDEFQNFATTSFTKLLSGGRKFGLRLTIAEQSTSQQEDHNIVNVILANTGTVICFRTASPVDEQLMLSQFSPYVEKGDIGSLPRYKFYMKLSAVEPEEPFSGETLPIVLGQDIDKIQRVIEASRTNFAIVYAKQTPKISQPSVKRSGQTSQTKKTKHISKGFIPDEVDD